MKTTLALVLGLLLSTPALAFMERPKDPHPNDPAHYQNAPVPVQTQLTDCWAFKVQTWMRPMDHWTHSVVYHCETIAQQHATGRPLSDTQQALESLLLAYEAEARAWSVRSIASADDEARYNESMFDKPAALLLASYWYMNLPQQEETANALGLLDVLSLLP